MRIAVAEAEALRDPVSGALVPEPMQPFVEALGLDRAVALCFRLGFGRINVPVDPGPGDALVRLAGPETAARLSAAMGGERLYVPFCRKFLIHYLRGRGATVPELARLLKCSDRYVSIALRDRPHWSKSATERTP